MNRLAGETSPYLLQHADNPVDWYPWGDEALERARGEDKPILLSVGYAACHWCHVMEHESFEDPATAAVMNEHFVNVKVDREERPDLDAIYMEAVVALTGQGGWPMTVFLTPDGRAVLRRHVLPARAAPRAAELPPGARRTRGRVAGAARRRHALGDAARRGRAALEPCSSRRVEPLTESAARRRRARAAVTASIRQWGGWGRAPKFPPAPALEFLLRHHLRTGDEDPSRWRPRRSTGWRSAACTTTSAAASTATRSTSAGSCRTSRRCSTTTRCSSPAYLHGWLVTGEGALPRDRRGDRRVHAARALARKRRLRVRAGRRHRRRRGTDLHVDGGGGRAGRAARAVRARPVDRPRRARRRATRAASSRSASCGRSRYATTRRSRPGTGSRSPRSPRPAGGSSAATGSRTRAASASSSSAALSDADGRLLRSYREGRTSGAGYLDDYANVAHGLLELHVATGELRWLEEANRLARLAVDLFGDEERGGFFLAERGRRAAGRADEGRSTTIRSRPGTRCSRTSCSASRRIYGDDELERRAVSVFRLAAPGARAGAVAPSAGRSVRSSSGLSPPRELAIVGDVDADVARAALEPGSPTRSSPSDRPTRCRCWPARVSSTAEPPSTSASASPVTRRSPTQSLYNSESLTSGPGRCLISVGEE